jgi:transcriptional regulator with XRE-family HTH domain
MPRIKSPVRLRSEVVRGLRKERKWSQGDLAERLGTWQERISRWEGGAPVHRRTVLAFALIYGRKPEEISEPLPAIADVPLQETA